MTKTLLMVQKAQDKNGVGLRIKHNTTVSWYKRLTTVVLPAFHQSRAALSLLGFCYYRLQDFQSAAEW